MNIRKQLTLGIDLGIGSCGWAIIRRDGNRGEISGWGTWTFDVPETDKERTPTNQLRREHRGLRKVTRRRRQRMNEIRGLFKKFELLESDGKSALKIKGLDPWRLRAEGLDRKLSDRELAVALGHIAKHRGFRSNSKRKSNEASDDSKMLTAIRDTTDRLAHYRTVGEMFWKDEAYSGRRRNRDGDYTRSVLRDDQEREVKLLLSQQRRMGSRFASEEMENAFMAAAFSQRPLADSEDKVGLCPFESDQKRAAKRSPSFETFRFLARLSALRVLTFHNVRALSPEEIALASADFGNQNGMTFRRLRKLIDVPDDARFEGVSLDDEGKRDVVNRSAGNGCMQGTKALRDALGDAAWNALRHSPDTLDRIAFVLTFREDPMSIRRGLAEIGLDPIITEALMSGVERGEFSDFKGAGSISAKACRAIIDHLRRGLVYSEACAAAGYDHSKRPATKLDQIANPVARKALSEAIKQVRAIVREHGLPDHIHVELARDVGKSKNERDEIARGIEKRNRAKDRLVEEFRASICAEPAGEDLLRYELWKEQKGRCLYCDAAIHPNSVVSSDNAIQIDHILPWSRSGDDSFVNKTLCHARCNQEKKGRTPYEWFGAEAGRWNTFVACIEATKEMKGRKKRNYTLMDATILEEKFRPRNLGDTRYATRLLLDELARWYPKDGKVHVYARPGPLTDRLRRGWGIQELKKRIEPDGEKRKADDRHHALDALIVAATSQSELAKLTRAFQEQEWIGGRRDFSSLEPPWPGFVEEVRTKFSDIFVSRAERRRARGEAHAATVRQIADRDGEALVFERKSVDLLTEKDLERVKDPERNARLVGSLRAWLEAGKPKDSPPLSPKGDAISKVRIRTDKRPAVLVREGAADRGDIVRVDIFRRRNGKGIYQYFLVPVYPHQIADVENYPTPPDRAVQGGAREEDWPCVDHTFEFCWSIFPLSYLRLTKSDGTQIEGYFRSLDRNTGALTISPNHTKQEAQKGIGPRTLKDFRKFMVDRLGQRFEIERETRTWHGVACT